jgi:hypothetical protein
MLFFAVDVDHPAILSRPKMPDFFESVRAGGTRKAFIAVDEIDPVPDVPRGRPGLARRPRV